MRSGNLPARYEVNTICPSVTATKSFGSSDGTIYVDKAPELFPDSGTLRIRQTDSATTADIEYVNYTGTTSFKQDVIATLLVICYSSYIFIWSSRWWCSVN